MADNNNVTGISIAGIPLEWNRNQGTCTFSGMPVMMMWVDSTLAGLMAEVQAMVGTERFSLALQSEGRKSVVADWQVISAHGDFSEGFQAIARVAATAGWGNWLLVSIDQKKRECIFRVSHSWEGKYQQSLGVNWGCSMLAGKLAGYCSQLFDTKCWAEQTSFTAAGDSTDTFIVGPSTKTIEEEINNLLVRGAATDRDIAVAMKKLQEEIQARTEAEQEKAVLETQLRRRHKMEVIGTLAGGIAHDFNNILAAILGYAEMALEEIPTHSQANRQIQEVLKAGTRAKNLVKQILAFSHREDQYREPVSLNALITEVVVFLRATIPTTIDILLDLAPDCGNILGDQTQIYQVLMNLCTNAGQAMETEGGTLAITLREETLAYKVPVKDPPLQGTYLCLDIADTGNGIPEKYLERIFDPYFTTKEFGKGSGMGLAVVQGIVKSHDGRMKVVNNPDKGVTFSLYFPRIDAQTKLVETEPLETATGSERILVVDDEPSIARMLEIVLRNNGYAVQTFSSSTKALEIFRANPSAFDLLLTDMTMPDLTGDNLALAIHQLRPDIPIILCTGYSSRIDELQAQEVGVQAFLMKPVDFKELTATVRRLLDNNPQRKS